MVNKVWFRETDVHLDAVTIPLAMKAAIYNGMLSEGVEPLTASCPTGNCTWPETPTLAVCGECVKSTYQTRCDNVNCNYTMPSGNVAVQANFWTPDFSFGGDGFNIMQGPGAVYKTNDSSIIYISNFDFFGAPYNSYRPTYAQSNRWLNPVSSERALWMCIQVMNVTTTRSQQLQSSPIQLSKVVNSSLFSSDTSVNLTFISPPPQYAPAHSPNYTVDAIAIIFFLRYLWSIINGTVFLNLESSMPSSDATQAIWNGSADLDAWIKNLAISMTNVVRTNIPAPADAFYDGTGFQLGIQIHWGWISLPALLVLASVLILGCAITQTGRNSVRAWKGDPLAVLFMDVDPNIKQRGITQMDEFEGLQDAVGSERVVLQSLSTGGKILKQY